MEVGAGILATGVTGSRTDSGHNLEARTLLRSQKPRLKLASVL